VVYGPPYHQMAKLIVQPLKESNISTVIVVDALDECEDREPASAILSAIGEFVSEIPMVKFFITGRPVPHIRAGFGLPLVAKATHSFALHEVEQSQIGSDIELFFRHEFLEVAGQHNLDDWPTKECLDLLCKRAAGLFVFAVATVKFIDHRNNSPGEQLGLILQSPEGSSYEGETEFKTDTTLDSFYMSILQEAFGNNSREGDREFRSVLGAVILAATPLPPSSISTLLGFDIESVFPKLSSIHSLLVLQGDDNPVQPFHKSFPDFIVDPTRCINERFRISPPIHHLELFVGCLELMNRILEKDMCKLPSAVANSEVNDLHERIKKYLGPALQYACKSWHKHLAGAHTAPTPTITSALHQFLEKKFSFWLEVLSVLGATREAIDALEVAAKSLEVCRVSAVDVLPKFAFAKTGCRRRRLLTS